ISGVRYVTICREDVSGNERPGVFTSDTPMARIRSALGRDVVTWVPGGDRGMIAKTVFVYGSLKIKKKLWTEGEGLAEASHVDKDTALASIAGSYCPNWTSRMQERRLLNFVKT
ncbi:hypothetical protein STEG23_003997, partial [Scotinomys teguina]